MQQPETHFQLIELPWKVLVVDQFLSEAEIDLAVTNYEKDPVDFFVGDEDPEQIHFKELVDKGLSDILTGDRVKDRIRNFFGYEVELQSSSRIQIRKMTEDSPVFPPHVDYIDGRSIMTVLYLSPDWKKEHGGEFMAMKTEYSFNSDQTNAIDPIPGRMIFFENKKNHWHMVRKVKNWTRHSIFIEWKII
jgi:hypothetical protein